MSIDKDRHSWLARTQMRLAHSGSITSRPSRLGQKEETTEKKKLQLPEGKEMGFGGAGN